MDIMCMDVDGQTDEVGHKELLFPKGKPKQIV